jgi:hypothetical protein
MTIAAGVAKQLRYKVEATFGTAPGATGAQVLRRVNSTLDLSKDTYQSAEIADHRQVADMRHGVRRVGGNIKGELSPGTYKDFIAAALRRAWAAVTAITGASITIAGSGPYTLTRASGSYLTDGIKIGDVARLTAGSFTAGNLNKNILVTNVTALVVTGIVLNGSTLTAEGPIASATLAVTGKKTYVPASSHTDLSYSIEHWYSDISQSELFRGCKVNTVGINLPPTGMAEIDLGFIGQDITTDTAVYYTSPTAATATGIVAAVNGALLVGGTQIATCTGLSLNIAGGYTGDPVVGANTVPALLPGRVAVSGQFTAYFTDATLRDNFINEDEITLVVALTTSNVAAADFLTLVLPRIKVGGAGKDDGEKGLVATFPFTALYNSAGGAGISSEQTTLVVQDSTA